MRTNRQRINVAILLIILLLFTAIAPRITIVQADTTQVGTIVNLDGDVLNVRSGPGINYSIYGTLTEGTKVTIYGTSGSGANLWYKIKYNSKDAYIFGEYVTLIGTADIIITSLEYVQLAIDYANDDAHGYRAVPDDNIGYGPTKSFDCGGLITRVLWDTGILPRNVYYEPNSGYQWNLLEYGFMQLDYTSMSDLKEGDVLYKYGHTELYIGNGKLVGAHNDYGHPEAGDQTGTEVSVTNFYNNGWEYVFRPNFVEDPEPEPEPVLPTMFDINMFPESYRPMIMELHEKYPSWIFVPQETGYDFNYAVSKESTLGVSLVDNASISSWKSTQDGAYDWTTSTWKIFDGSRWVQASNEIVAYFMDPRTQITERGVFQFLHQGFDESTQTLEGVQKMIEKSFMAGNIPGEDISYAQCIYDAGRQYGVNPYIIASTIILEQGWQGNTELISGTYSGANGAYKGYYDHFNYGAYGATLTEVIENGLSYAKKQGWNTIKKSIYGGTELYAAGYIAAGQDTLYLKRFNVQGNNAFKHQYMTSISGALNQGVTLAGAYTTEMKQAPLVFKIPIYNNLPEICIKPTNDGSPNNRLAKIGITGEVSNLINNISDTSFSYTLPEGVMSINLTAKAYNSTATIKGTGTKNLKDGTNKYTITVTAENGDMRKYYVTVVAKAQTLSIPAIRSVMNKTGGVNITWDKTDGASSYAIYRKTESTDWSLLGTSTGNSYTDLAVASGTKYYYSVAAVDGNNQSGYNTDGTAIIYLKMPEITATSNLETGISLVWSKSGGAKGYYVYRREENGSWVKIATLKSGKTNYTDTNTTSGTIYYYSVKAYSGNWVSAYNTEGKKYMRLTAPALYGLSKVSGGVKIKWVKANGATSYEIYRKADGENYQRIATVGDVSTYIDKTAKKNVLYTYTVRSMNGEFAGRYDMLGRTITR